MKVPDGYRGLVYGKKASLQEMDDAGNIRERVTLDRLGRFDEVIEWQKDAWVDERGYPTEVMNYLNCAKIIHE